MSLNNDDLLANFAAGEFDEPEGGFTAPSFPETWEPPGMSDIQKEVYWDDESLYILMSGGRASGKSWIAGHKLIRHCYEHVNALAIVIVGVRRMATAGGLWHAIENEMLPSWQAATGIQFTQSRTDVSKDTIIDMQNRYGGWSRIMLLSMPVAAFIGDRVKGITASHIVIEEAQTLSSPDYYEKTVQQVGRRKETGGGATDGVHR